MKKIALNRSLRTAVFTALVATLVGVSACSSEKEEVDTNSGEVMAVERGDDAAELASEKGSEAEDIAFERTDSMATSDADVAAEANNRATTEDAAGATDMPEATDRAATDKPETDIMDNPNANKTPADGVQ